jgi:hypothetical protein
MQYDDTDLISKYGPNRLRVELVISSPNSWDHIELVFKVKSYSASRRLDMSCRNRRSSEFITCLLSNSRSRTVKLLNDSSWWIFVSTKCLFLHPNVLYEPKPSRDWSQKGTIIFHTSLMHISSFAFENFRDDVISNECEKRLSVKQVMQMVSTANEVIVTLL